MSKLSEELIKIRTANNLTQEQFAEGLFVTRQAVSKWERDICYPDIEILKQIAVKYRVSLNLMLDILKQNKSEEVKRLAGKSYFFVAIMLIGTLLCFLLGFVFLFFATDYNDQSRAIESIPFLIAGVIGVIIMIPIILSPSTPIRYNDFGLFISTIFIKNKFIKFEEIIDVKAVVTHTKRINYTFGKIIITTNNNVYILRNIRRVDFIKGKIIELKTLNTYCEV